MADLITSVKWSHLLDLKNRLIALQTTRTSSAVVLKDIGRLNIVPAISSAIG
jgi:hypothetical protein